LQQSHLPATTLQEGGFAAIRAGVLGSMRSSPAAVVNDRLSIRGVNDSLT
jgi:hypothetical protein